MAKRKGTKFSDIKNLQANENMVLHCFRCGTDNPIIYCEYYDYDPNEIFICGICDEPLEVVEKIVSVKYKRISPNG